jgi:hypothetical protein
VTIGSAPYTLTGDERAQLRGAVDRARRVRLRIVAPEVWLQDQLVSGGRPAADLVAAARELGIGRRSLLKAARRLRVEGCRGPV